MNGKRAALVAMILLSAATPCVAQVGNRAMGGAYRRQDVDKPAAKLPGIGAPPRYPDAMRTAKRDGIVRVRFIVDRRGVPQISTFQVIQSDDSTFSASVQSAVADWRFTPARRKETKVSQVVELGFYFGLADLPSRAFNDKEIDVIITAGSAGIALPN